MKKSTPSLPMSSRMAMPSSAKPAIKGAIKGAKKVVAKTMIKKK